MRGLLLLITGILLLGLLVWQALRIPGNSSAPQDNNSENAGLQESASDATDSAQTLSAADIPSDVVPVWKEWPQPDVALILTGEQHGYFEPCGCTANQMGGMSRRADLAARLQQAGWTVRGIDLGGVPRRTSLQAQIKFDTSLRALNSLNYVAVGVGAEELRLQPDFLLTMDDQSGSETATRLVSANLVFFGSPDIGTPIPSRIVRIGQHTIGITSVMTESVRNDVLPEGGNSDITWSDPQEALNRVQQTFDQEQVTFRILLSHGTSDDSRKLAQKNGQFNVVVTAQGFGDPDPRAEPEKIGDTLLLQLGHKGKYVGVLGLYPEDSEMPVRFQLIPLERSDFEDRAEMIDLMQEYQQRLLDEEILVQDGAVSHPSGATFVGADKCGECHTTAHEIWAATPHAHALESLDPAHKRKGHERLNGVVRLHDPECLSCHVTGWNPQEYLRYRSGFLNQEFAQTADEQDLHQRLAGNQCENCHGPGSQHVELIEAGETEQARSLVRVTLEQSKQVCARCHDPDNSPDFNFDTYWPKVEHKGLD